MANLSSKFQAADVDARITAVVGDTLNGRTIEVASMADDTAWSFDFTQDAFAGNVIISRNGAGNNGLFEIRATGSSAFCNSIASTGITATTGALTGTTGADGALTISAHTDQKLYVENRLGGAITFAITINSPYLP